MNPFRSQAIKAFLNAKTHPDLASLYNKNMEVQVNVAQGSGTRVDGDFKGRQWHAWSDGVQTWGSFRIPYQASTDPVDNDREIKFDLEVHAEGIGMTGWDWGSKVSRWVAYDFDAITGHSDKHAKKLTQAELNEIETLVRDIPWCTLRKSTSGRGLHLYVFLDPIISTKNHNEHAALARAILGMLSALTRFDFKAKVDANGGNFWVWHRKMIGTDGLTLLKQGESLKEIPPNWQDHIKVVTGSRRKIAPNFIEKLDLFERLTTQRSKINLDEDHSRLIKYLQEHNYTAWWDNDHWMLVTHTYHLKKAHTDLKLKGVFETLAQGTETPNDHNCFMFVLANGAWSVRRYTQGVQEASTWTQDSSGWTFCTFNKELDLPQAARNNSGVEHPKGGFVFTQAEAAVKAANSMGAEINLPSWIISRQTVLKKHKDGRLIVEIEQNKDSDLGLTGMEGWISEKSNWKRIFEAKANDTNEINLGQYDSIVRHIITQNNDDAGWVIQTNNNWINEPLVHIGKALKSMGFSIKDTEMILGICVAQPFILVNKPFQDEYPSGREWNRNSIQLAFTPTEEKDVLSFPTWLKVLSDVGSGLNSAIKENSWCKANGVLTGGDYLKIWIASLFQFPYEQLPYLFFYGEENVGKSTFHEVLSLLVTHGIVRADAALTSNFNGELANSIVCVVEEIDIHKNKLAYNRIKDYVTAKQISIRPLYQQSYMIDNTTHWCQISNDPRAAPIFPGDTRITAIYVDKLKETIPKRDLFPMLRKEAPDFLAEILALEIPQSMDRLNVPVIVTDEKLLLGKANRSILEIFINEICFDVPGKCIAFNEFYDRFREFVDPMEANNWTKMKLAKELPTKFPKGRLDQKDSKYYIGNVSWTKEEATTKLTCKDDILIPEGSTNGAMPHM